MENKLFYHTPYQEWNNALPLGNGRLGAMVAGIPKEDVISLNEDSLWHGKYHERDSRVAREHLDEVRNLLFNGSLGEAEKLVHSTFTSTPKYIQPYQPLGELKLWFSHGENVDDYYRELDLSKAIVSVSYTTDGIKIKREHLISAVDNVLAIKITADKPIKNFWFNLMRRPFENGCETSGDNIISMSDTCGEGGVFFSCAITAQTNGSIKVVNDFLEINDATESIIYLAANTEYYVKNPKEECKKQLKAAIEKGYEKIKADHIKDYQALYNRVSLDIGSSTSDIPTDCRIKAVKEGKKDIGLSELMYNFGRYLMISSSRPGTQAMNLQGIWNDKFAPSWECNYTININTQCNYWAAEACDLSECHEPMFDLIKKMLPNGRKTAKIMYGCNGFVAHHGTNIWGDTAMNGSYLPSVMWPMGAAWMSLHLYEHYEYTLDTEFLKNKAYPILKEAALFFTEYMVKDADGYWVTGPSLSPENSYLRNGETGTLCMGPAMDLQIVHSLFDAVIESAEILGVDEDFSNKLKSMLENIRAVRINKYGGILEWDQDYDEVDPNHRHISPLFALYPGKLINYRDDIDGSLRKACQTTIARRDFTQDGSITFDMDINWARVWKGVFYARMLNGEKSLDYLDGFFANGTSVNLFAINGTLPFQIEANLGAIALVNEMLLQSHMGELYILPALPERWKNGSVKGIMARGGFKVDITWQNGKLIDIKVLSKLGGKCRLRLPMGTTVSGNTETINDGEVLSFETQPNTEYVFNA